MADDETISFRREAAARRRRVLVTAGVVLLALFWTFWYIRSYRIGPTRAAEHPTACERVTTVDPPRVHVTVENASSTPGLAAKVATGLTKAGFEVDRVGNAPKGTKAAGPATVLYGADADAEANTVLQWLPGATVEEDVTISSGVRVVVGKDFTKVRSTPAEPPCR